jgi:hypothetical protein
MSLDVLDLYFDEENERKLAAHGVTIAEVIQVWTDRPRYFKNRGNRRATHAMMGETADGRLLLIPIERLRPGLWRPVTGMDPTPHQRGRYGG